MPRSLYDSYLGQRVLKPINQKIISSGFSAAFRLILKKTNSRLKVSGLTPSLRQTLRSEPVLLIANHPNQAEVLAILAALPHRSDYYLIVSHSFCSILPAFDRHLIPVYISHRLMADHPSWKLKFFQKFHRQSDFDQVAAHQQNIASITLASRKLAQGALVQIFPTLDDTVRNFSPGVGHLLKNSKPVSRTKVVMIHTAGTSDFDYLRLLPFLGRLLPPFKLTFSPAYQAADFVADTGRDTAKNLEVAYRSWTDSLDPKLTQSPFGFRAINRSYLFLRSVLIFLFSQNIPR